MDKPAALRRTLVRGIIIFAIGCVVVWGLQIGLSQINPIISVWIYLASAIQFLSYAIPTITGVLIAALIILTGWQRISVEP